MGNNKSSPSTEPKEPKEPEDIIIKCHYTEIAKLFKGEYSIIWHDPNINSQTNLSLLEPLKAIGSPVQTFTEWEQAFKHIKSLEKSCLVISSGNDGKLLAENIEKLANVQAIYIFCFNTELHKQWAKEFKKVAIVENHFNPILSAISQKINSLRTDFPAFAPAFDANDTSTLNHLSLYLQGFRKFNNRKQAKQDFLNLANLIYQDKDNMKEFYHKYEYEMKAALTWYTKQSFFYQTVNNCLRLATIDAIQYARLPLRDVEDAIKQQFLTKSKEFNGLLYRGTFMMDSEWESLKNNLNKEVEMFGFLSTSSSRKIAVDFLNKNAQKIFITIIIPPYLEDNEQGFAEVKEFSIYPNEEEVLFNVRSRFTILETSVEKINDDFECRHLVLLYGALGLRKYIAKNNPVTDLGIDLAQGKLSCSDCKAQFQQESPGFVNMAPSKNQYTCMECMKKDNPERKDPYLLIYPQNALKIEYQIKGMFMEYKENFTLPFYGSKCIKCDENGRKMYHQFRCISCDDGSRTWCEKCFDLNEISCAKEKHNIIIENRPFTFWMQKASDYELERLKHQEELLQGQSSFAHASALFNSHKYQEAESYYLQYLKQNQNEKDSIQSGYAHNNLGRIYYQLGKYSLANKHYDEAIEIFSPFWTFVLAGIYMNKGMALTDQGEYKLALVYSAKALELHQQLNMDEFGVATIYNNIGNLYEIMGELHKSIEYCLTAYNIWEKIGKEKHPYAANALNNLGLAYKKLEKYDQALKYYHMSLKLKLEILGEKNPTTADSYNNIGMAYVAIQDFENAQTYLEESLKIRLSIFGENHTDTIDCYANLGCMYLQMGNIYAALALYMKARDRALETFGPNHPDTKSILITTQNLQHIYAQLRISEDPNEDEDEVEDEVEEEEDEI